MQLKAKKSDGSVEVYLHTKVMGSIARALAECDSYLEGQPEQLAEAVTTYLRRRYQGGFVASDEINSMIEVVLCDTGFENAALALHEHRFNRKIRRRRVEVAHVALTPQIALSIDPAAWATEEATELWNKSVIVQDLEKRHGLAHNLARAVAGTVEEKVLGLGCRRVTAPLVRELVANELWVMMQAEKTLDPTDETEIENLLGDAAPPPETPTEYTAVAVDGG